MIGLICIDDYKGRCDLTKGKIYLATSEWGYEYCGIKNDKGKISRYIRYRFKRIDCNVCQTRKCNSCPISKEKGL